MKDYSGFYYNIAGVYENLIYYISPMPEQKLYMIKKYNPIVSTTAIIKSIETGFNGYDYEVYGVNFLSFPFENPNDENELCALVEFLDFSNRQVFDGTIIVPETMPNHDEFVEYLKITTCKLPIVIDDRKKVVLFPEEHENKEISKPVQQQPVVEQPQVEQPKPVEQPRNFNEQLETPQMKAQADARTIASQIVQNNEQDINNQ